MGFPLCTAVDVKWPKLLPNYELWYNTYSKDYLDEVEKRKRGWWLCWSDGIIIMAERLRCLLRTIYLTCQAGRIVFIEWNGDSRVSTQCPTKISREEHIAGNGLAYAEEQHTSRYIFAWDGTLLWVGLACLQYFQWFSGNQDEWDATNKQMNQEGKVLGLGGLNAHYMSNFTL